MSQRARKLIGTVLLIAFVAVYSLVVMALATSRLPAMGGAVSFAFYACAGLLWVLPAGAIIAWMQRS
jgi:hypothetical protein